MEKWKTLNAWFWRRDMRINSIRCVIWLKYRAAETSSASCVRSRTDVSSEPLHSSLPAVATERDLDSLVNPNIRLILCPNAFTDPAHIQRGWLVRSHQDSIPCQPASKLVLPKPPRGGLNVGICLHIGCQSPAVGFAFNPRLHSV
jgi:hypothetical protein